MGEVGEDIPSLADTRPQLKPHIDSISLSPEGRDFSSCVPQVGEAPELDLFSIELAAPGADVPEQQYKKKEEPSAPNTSHLSLDQK